MQPGLPHHRAQPGAAGAPSGTARATHLRYLRRDVRAEAAWPGLPSWLDVGSPILPSHIAAIAVARFGRETRIAGDEGRYHSMLISSCRSAGLIARSEQLARLPGKEQAALPVLGLGEFFGDIELDHRSRTLRVRGGMQPTVAGCLP